MIKNSEEINTDLLTEICSSFETTNNFNLVKKQFPDIEHNMLYSILFSTGKYDKELYSTIQQLLIEEDKILIISDTHYGSTFEELRYTYEVFEFAKAHGVKTILHGGDIIEGDTK